MRFTTEQLKALAAFKESREGLEIHFAREGFMWLEPYSALQPKRAVAYVRYNGELVYSLDGGTTWRFDNKEKTVLKSAYAIKLLRQHFNNRKLKFMNAQPWRNLPTRRKASIVATWSASGEKVRSWV